MGIKEKELKNQLNGDILKPENDDNPSEIYLFISFDLVNATEFKIRNLEWQNTFTNFYNLISKKIKENNSPLKNATIWKYIGDEILFYLKITKQEQLFKFLPFIEKIIKATENKLNSKSIYFDPLYIKTTAWIAQVYPDNSKIPNNEAKNIKFTTFDKPGYKYDFLGPDIDLGFRISKYSRKSIITIDAKLAFLLYKFKEEIKNEYGYNIEQNLKIISYQKLKGILRGHYYPIIWCSLDWNIKNIFIYDEHINNEEILYIQNKIKNNKTELLSNLEKFFQDTNQKDDIQKIIDIIKKTEEKKDFPELKEFAEVHVAIICFYNDKIITFKRDSNKQILPNIWEFGCGQVKPNESFIETAKRTFKNDFNLNIELFEKPIAIYEVIKKNQKIPGIILFGEILDESLKNINFNGGHITHKLLSYDDIKNLKYEKEYVEKFKENALKAFESYKSIKKMKD